MADDNTWVTVASTYFLAEADVIQSVLAEHDIDVFLKGEHTAGLAAPLSLMDRGVRVQVRSNNEVRALEILREFEMTHATEDDSEDESSPTEEPEKLSWNPRAVWALITSAALTWIVLRVILSN